LSLAGDFQKLTSAFALGFPNSRKIRENADKRRILLRDTVTAILLGHLKKDASEVKKALLSLDQGLLTPECLKQLIDYAPDDDEVCLVMFVANY